LVVSRHGGFEVDPEDVEEEGKNKKKTNTKY
jgi:hypothetical protein